MSTQFRTGYSTTLINNLSSANSLNSNCEEDYSKPLLNNVHELLLDYKAKSQTDNRELDDQVDESEAFEDVIVYDPVFSKMDYNFVENEAITYISSIICGKILNKTSCVQCINSLQSSSVLEAHDIIHKLSDCEDNVYRNPSVIFMQSFKILFSAINDIIPDLCSEKLLKTKIITQLEKVQIDEIGCPEHMKEMTLKLKQYVTYYAIIDFCKKINSLLSGKVTVIPPNSDRMQQLALAFRKKGKHIGKHSDKFTV